MVEVCNVRLSPGMWLLILPRRALAGLELLPQTKNLLVGDRAGSGLCILNMLSFPSLVLVSPP